MLLYSQVGEGPCTGPRSKAKYRVLSPVLYRVLPLLGMLNSFHLDLTVQRQPRHVRNFQFGLHCEGLLRPPILPEFASNESCCLFNKQGSQQALYRAFPMSSGSMQITYVIWKCVDNIGDNIRMTYVVSINSREISHF